MKIINKIQNKNKYLSLNERYFIYMLSYYDNLSNRENQRNKWNKFKVENNNKLKEFIIDYLNKDWSPEQISWRLEKMKLKTEVGYVCTETIYKLISESEQWKMLKLHFKLMRHRQDRKKYSSRARNWFKVKIKDRIWIKYRFSNINKRKELWYWETDTMEFNRKRKTKYVLSVQVERKSRFVKITRFNDKTANETYWALLDLTNEYHEHWIVKSITFDNWLEWAYHYKIKEEFEDVDTYFCDSFKSWQKWSVENMHPHLRFGIALIKFFQLES